LSFTSARVTMKATRERNERSFTSFMREPQTS
jgi:hypothetical protein